MTTTGASVAELQHGRYAATVVAIGASLRSLTADGRDLVVPFGPDEPRPVFRGAVLAPWPNRVVDGRYTFEGQRQQLELTEGERGHALHGLLADVEWEVDDRSEESVTLQAVAGPAPGYPHRVRVAVMYALADDGLTTTVSATSEDGPAPYGVSAHPYLTAGGARLDTCTLTLPADRYVETEGERLLPAGEQAVEAAPWPDFRTPTVIGAARIDHAFTGLHRDRDGTAQLRLAAPDGLAVEMSWGLELPWLQIHTADRPEPELDRAGLAVEPMTCPPDAFNSGQDLVVLRPGEGHRAAWRIAAG